MAVIRSIIRWLLGISSFKHLVSGKDFAGNNYGLSDLLIYCRLVAPGVILQTDGSFLSGFWFRGTDAETSSDEELSILSQQLNLALNLLGNGWMLHIDTLRHQSTSYINKEASFFTQEAGSLIDNERRLKYQNGGKYYENVYAVSFTYKPKIDLTDKVGMFFQQGSLNQNSLIKDSTFQDYSYHLNYFQEKLDEVTHLITQQLNLVEMDDQSLISYLSWCITGEAVELKLPLNYGTVLKHFLASKDLAGGDYVKVGDKFVRAVTVMGFPNESFPGILDRLNYIDFEYRFNTRFIFLDSYESSKMIDRLSNLWYQKRVHASDAIKQSLAIESNVKINRVAESQYVDAENAKALSDLGEVKFGFYSSSILLMSEDEELVEKHAAKIRAELRGLGFQSQIERYHTLEVFLGSLPGYSYANVRKWMIHTQNLADLIPNTAIWSGLAANPCSLYKNTPPLFYAMTNGATPMRISLHVGDNGHTLILGPTGSGKSTLLNFIIAQHFRYKDARVFVFDKNKSALPLCHCFEGNFYDIGEETNHINFQPLANLETDFDFDFAANWLEELCILNGMQDTFKNTHRNAIHKGLQLLSSETNKQRRTISYFRHLVQDYDKLVAQVLEKFTAEQGYMYTQNTLATGVTSRIFDANHDALFLTDNKLNVFEMGRLMELGDKIIIPAIRYLIQAINKHLNTGEPTLIVFDESFMFFKHNIFREKIIEWIKTVRKFNVAIVFATQELHDLFEYSELRSALMTNCATKIFLPNRKAASIGTCEQYLAMGLNAKQIRLISQAFKGDYFYFSELGNRKFSLDLETDSATFNIVARTSHADIQKAIILKQKYPNSFMQNWLREYL